MAHRGVHEAPGNAARGLLDWGTDLWHYVNGKALVSGLRLLEMEASEMLDVLHYLFEEDQHYTSSEQAQARSQVRSKMYKDLYNKDYKYAFKEVSAKSLPSVYNPEEFPIESSDESEVEIKPFNPRAQPTKAYTPTTTFDPSSSTPFGMTLDSPVN